MHINNSMCKSEKNKISLNNGNLTTRSTLLTQLHFSDFYMLMPSENVCLLFDGPWKGYLIIKVSLVLYAWL